MAQTLAIDSSCWLEVFGGGAMAPNYRDAIARPDALVVPIVTVYEVYKHLLRARGEAAATRAAQYMEQGLVVPVDWPIMMAAAQSGLPLADSLIYATARAHDVTLWTQDAHFKGLTGVRYFSESVG